MKRGKLIAIEGTDGSGKATTVEAIKERFERAGIPVEAFSFPRYDTPTGRRVRAYLDGKEEDPIKVAPKEAAKLYTDDRQAASPEIEENLKNGVYVLCDRYIGSNLAHQGAKVSDMKERESIIAEIEADELDSGIPKPDLTVLLNLNPELARKAMEQQGRKQDGHEANSEYQQAVVETYLWLARTRIDWKQVECVNGSRRKTVDEIADEIWSHISPLVS